MAKVPEFAPLNVPLERRLQTAAVVFFVTFQFICWVMFLISLYVWFTRPFALAYMVWMYIDWDTPKNGIGRRSEWVRSWSLWKHFCNYFPSKLIREVELDPREKYLFAYHPHGIIGMGCLSNFATDGNGIGKLFPGLRLFVCTLFTNFKIPFYREYIMSLGLADVGKRSLRNIFNHNASALIVIGGANEALDAHPGTYDLTLKKRKGFIKIALVHGANLVPVFAFGENDIYEQVDNPRGSKLRALQQHLLRVMGFSMPLIKGRGVFQYTYGILPRRKPITVVVGKPIKVEQVEEPTNEQIEALHQVYVKELQAVFDRHKDTFARERKKSFSIVE
eukprot:Colp12_sorted_trinity150504_noHs@3607